MPGLIRASALHSTAADPAWTCEGLSGRFVELSGAEASATMTTAVGLVRDAQVLGEPVAWITREESTFYPPDVVEHGVDLDALVVVRVPAAHDIARCADTLVRSGAFGLAILDLGEYAMIPMPLQARLLKLAQQLSTAVVCLTTKPAEAPSLSSLISLRAEGCRTRARDGSYACEVRILKDKQRPPTWIHQEQYRGPVGLR